MRRRRIGVLTIAGVVVAHTVAWLAFPPAADGRPQFARQYAAEYLAATAVLLFAVALVLATRMRRLEPWFGGLDRMYRVHRRVAVVGFTLLVCHVAVVPWTLQSGGGTPSGLIAFVGLAVLVVLSVGPGKAVALRYSTWRRSHRLVGVFFLISLAHALLVDQLVTTAPVPFGLLIAAYAAGGLAYLYILLVARFVRPRYRYTVHGVERLDSDTVELALTATTSRRLAFRAGQFVFVRIHHRGLREPHPFTVSSAPAEDLLRLTIKASGDFTRRLHQRAEVGSRATVEGAYGMLDHRAGGRRQIWIAGGIGITPFLSWLREARLGDRRIDLYYAVRRPEQALFWEEITAAAARQPHLRAHRVASVENGRLTVTRIAADNPDLPDAHLFMCGPAPMVRALARDLQRAGVPAAHIHFEEFAFR